MELDDFKNIRSSEKIAGTPENTIPDANLVMQRFEETMKKETRTKRMVITFLIVLSVLYIPLGLNSEKNIGLMILAAGFITGALYLFIRYRPLPDNIFLLPLREFTEVAARRLKYFALTDWLIIPPILVVLGIGGGIHLVKRLSQYTDNTWLIIGIWVIFFTGLCIFGYFAGKKNWKTEHNELLSDLERLRESLKDIKPF